MPHDFEWALGMIYVIVYFEIHGIKREKHGIWIRPDASIDDIIDHIKSSKCMTGTLTLSLTKNGAKLKSDSTLEGSVIMNDSRLYLTSYRPRRKSRSTYRIQVKICNLDKRPIRLTANDPSELYHKVQDAIGMAVDEQAWFNGDTLLDTYSSVVKAMNDQHCLLKVKWSPKTHTGTYNPVHSNAEKSVPHSEAQRGIYQYCIYFI